MSSPDDERFHSFAEFYPYYLQEHSNAVCRRLHYVAVWAHRDARALQHQAGTRPGDPQRPVDRPRGGAGRRVVHR